MHGLPRLIVINLMTGPLDNVPAPLIILIATVGERDGLAALGVDLYGVPVPGSVMDTATVNIPRMHFSLLTEDAMMHLRF